MCFEQNESIAAEIESEKCCEDDRRRMDDVVREDRCGRSISGSRRMDVVEIIVDDWSVAEVIRQCPDMTNDRMHKRRSEDDDETGR